MPFGGAVKLTGESEYRKALKQITQNLREVAAEMKAVTTKYDDNDRSEEALNAKTEKLNKTLELQKDKLKNLRSEYDRMKSEYDEQSKKHEGLNTKYQDAIRKLDELKKTVGENSQEYKDQSKVVADLAADMRKSTSANEANAKSMSELRVQMSYAEADINKTSKAVDELGKETEESGKQAEQAANGGFTVFKGIVANLASTAITEAAKGLKKLADGLIDVGKQAYSNYAEYEQLVGGVETLYGKSADKLIKNAENAYKTAGVSANKYMEQSTLFAATLLQGLEGDTEAAVKYADVAIKDMADNANKLGTSVESIQNAYQGFAKQNFTMLDNLRLGYGGTAGEMARLINDTKVLGDEVEVTAKTVKEVPFAKMIEAIHIVQQNIGITGTTLAEAEGTIEGSTKAMKAAWDNLTVAIASDNADVEKSVKAFTDNAVIYAKNAVPRIKKIAEGLKKAVVQIVKEVAPEPTKKILPVLKTVKSVVEALFNFILKNGKTIISILAGIVAGIAAFKVVSIISTVISAFQTLFATIKAGTGIMAAFNAVMAANPIAVVIGLLVGAAGLIATMKIFNETTEDAIEYQDELTKKLESQREETQKDAEKIRDARDAWDELKKAQQDCVDEGQSEMDYYSTLVTELDKIVGADGRVKEGYEKRAQFITTTLADAFGVEIKYQDGIIKGYQNMRDEIDLLIAKQRAQIVLDSQKSTYEAAISQKDDAINSLKKAREDLSAAEETRDEWKAVLDSLNDSVDNGVKVSIKEMQDAMMKYDDAVADVNDKMKNVEDWEDTIKSYAFAIGQYNKTTEAFFSAETKKDYDAISAITYNYIKDLETSGNKQKALLEKQISDGEMYLELIKEMYGNGYDDIVDSVVKTAETGIERYRDNMKAFTTVTDEELKNNKRSWDEYYSEVLSNLTGKKVEFKKVGEDQIRAYIDGKKVGIVRTEGEMANLAKNVVDKAFRDTLVSGSIQAGKDSVNGLATGVNDQKTQKNAFQSLADFGKSLLNTLKKSLKEKSPSTATAEMGRYLIEGLNLGMESRENTALQTIRDFGSSVVDSFRSLLSGVSGVGEAVYAARTSSYSSQNPLRGDTIGTAEATSEMVSAFKTALADMKIELDDDEVGRFVDKTVTRLVYS